ncbi:Hypothetical predicted protein [Podarcis lilfordi]|uniref:Uncharacterized protein n=1 Tax=Podarcis lilfordi TaxID=74358 RepID=A0AA35PMI2_9SAUR|nr:Hypothetical predicted protein [Podarcis lilfordi]
MQTKYSKELVLSNVGYSITFSEELQTRKPNAVTLRASTWRDFYLVGTPLQGRPFPVPSPHNKFCPRAHHTQGKPAPPAEVRPAEGTSRPMNSHFRGTNKKVNIPCLAGKNTASPKNGNKKNYRRWKNGE